MDSEGKSKLTPDPWEIGFGVVLVSLALLALLLWFPQDIAGSFIQTTPSGRVGPGDAFFPTLLAIGIALLSAVHLLRASFAARAPSQQPKVGRLSLANLSFLVRFHLIVGLGLAAMALLGPLSVQIANALLGGTATYRELVDTPPYKYIGYVGGALLMTLPLIHWAAGRLTLRMVVIVIAVVLTIIVLFDGLLRNVQLPPNADV